MMDTERVLCLFAVAIGIYIVGRLYLRRIKRNRPKPPPEKGGNLPPEEL